MSELRAGGMALIIGLKTYAELNGHSVLLEKMVSPGEVFTSPCGRGCMSGAQEESWIVTGNVYSSNGFKGWCQLAPKNLMPIDGEDFSHEDERQKELTND